MECSIGGCMAPRVARGYCQAHYRRWRLYGDPKAHIPLGSVGSIRLAENPPACDVDGCERRPKGQGLCPMHYQRKAKTGSTGPAEPLIGRCLPTIERLERFIERTETCWLWTGARSGKGYGIAAKEGTGTAAHRAVYEAHVGPIPAGLTLDHLCMVRHCVNPAHLEPVTVSENNKRAWRARRGETV